MKNFVVAAHERSGSSLLMKSLNTHPELTVYGEVLGNNAFRHLKWREDRNFPREATPENSIKIAEKCFEQANGFKIIYHQAINFPIWDYLKDTKIIFLSRKDLFKAYVSRMLSLKNNIWSINLNQEIPQEEPIYINPAEYKIWLDYVHSEDEKLKAKLTNHIHIFYEDLILYWDETIRKICDFVDVKYVKLEKTLKQYRSRHLDLVTNYGEVYYYLKNTKYNLNKFL